MNTNSFSYSVITNLIAVTLLFKLITHSPGFAVVRKFFVPSDKLKKFTTSSTEPGDCLNKYLVEHIFIIVFPFFRT